MVEQLPVPQADEEAQSAIVQVREFVVKTRPEAPVPGPTPGVPQSAASGTSAPQPAASGASAAKPAGSG